MANEELVPVEIALGGTELGPGPETRERPPLDRGQRVGEYVLDGVLGSGSFGTVYAAAHPVIGKRVAIKVLDRTHESPEVVARFIAEARAVNQIGHPSIVDIFAFGELEDGRRYYVMERLEGQSLEAHLHARGALPLSETLEILGPVGQALDAAHAAGIAHRDLKPENLFLVRGEGGLWRPKLLDFGVAKMLHAGEGARATQSGCTVGTPRYMSPEQCTGRDVDHRSDIYSFGVVAYHMLVGRPPFPDDSSAVVMAQHLYEEPEPPSKVRPELPREVSDAILWMMEKDRARRPATLAAAVAALAAAGQGQAPRPSLPASQTKVDLPAALRKQRGRGRRGVLWATLGGLVVAVAVLPFWLGRGRAPTPQALAAISAPPQAPAAAATAQPPPAPVLPARVRLDVRGTPDGTTVTDDHGHSLGEAPGVIELDRGTTGRKLVLEAPGYVRRVVEVVPDRDQALAIDLPAASRKARRAEKKPAAPGHRARPDDIEPWR